MLFNLSRRKGFTLVEVMVATVVLSLGVVMVYESFFISVDTFNYYLHSLQLNTWMSEKIWEAKNYLEHQKTTASIDTTGECSDAGLSCKWDMAYDLIGETEKCNLYHIALNVNLYENKRNTRLSRSAYALYERE